MLSGRVYMKYKKKGECQELREKYREGDRGCGAGQSESGMGRGRDKREEKVRCLYI